MAAPSDNGDQRNIVNLPRYRQLATAAKAARLLARWAPRIAPLARIVGLDMSKIENAAKEAAELAPSIEAMLGVPDRFNAIYSRLGWVAYSTMSHQLMLDAIDAGERGDLAAGESLLTEYFTKDKLEFHLTRMSTLSNFAERMRLAKLTKVDFLEGRFHACVPNLLMLIDGLASDVAESSESFFSDRADLTAWDSVEGHPTGLPALARLMSLSRQKRRTDDLKIPYRHGILHGRDLGFANKLVAAKCWGALFALGDWARQVEQGQKNPPPPKPRLALRESLRAFVKQRESIRRWQDWQPTHLVIGRDLPASGSPSDYLLHTAERALVEFLSHWRARNYGGMASLVTIGVNKVDPRVRARDINRTYRDYKLENFALERIEERGPMATAIDAECTIVGDERRTLAFVLVYEDEQGDWLKTEWDKGTWRVLNWHVVQIASSPQ